MRPRYEIKPEAKRSLDERRLLPLPLAHDGPIAPTRNLQLTEYFRGALLGTAIGDALGRPAEGRGAATLRERYGRLDAFRPWHGWSGGPRGTITDDTQMTMCVAECLVANDGRIDPEDLARRFVEWLPVGRGKGHTCVTAVHRLQQGMPWYEAGVASAGNGAAMRAAPVGLALLGDVDALRTDAALSAVVTHADPMAVVSAVAHAWFVARLVATPPGLLEVTTLLTELRDVLADLHDPGAPDREWQERPGKGPEPVRLVDRLLEVGDWLDAPPHEAGRWFHSGAFVLESLPMALWHFLASPDDPEETVVRAVMGGHDADTVASMAGAYAGAYLGESAFPDRWTGDDLEYADETRALADRLLELARPALGAPGT